MHVGKQRGANRGIQPTHHPNTASAAARVARSSLRKSERRCPRILRAALSQKPLPTTRSRANAGSEAFPFASPASSSDWSLQKRLQSRCGICVAFKRVERQGSVSSHLDNAPPQPDDSAMPRLRNLSVAALSLFLCGCGLLRMRSPVPADQISAATLPGYEHARYWGDTIDEGLQASFVESWKQEREYRKSRNLGDSIAPQADELAISGGGQNGAFGAGLLCGWTAAGVRPQFNVVTGISTGALISPFVFLGPEYDRQLKEVYTTSNMADVAVFRGVVDLLRGDSAYDTAPLVKLVHKYFTREMINQIAVEHKKGRRLFIGTTNLDAERPVIWDMGVIASSDRPDRDELFRNVMLASAAIPGAFAPVYFRVVGPDGKSFDELHVDGGVTREMFLMPSELHLFELRAQAGTRAVTNLYVIRNSKLEPEYATVPASTLRIAARSIDTLIKAQAMNDAVQLYDEAQANQMTFHLASIPLDINDDSQSMFDSKYMTQLFDRGFALSRGGYPWQLTPQDWWRKSHHPAPATQVSEK
jgi:predicted acylesterase/phospholipase RssA